MSLPEAKGTYALLFSSTVAMSIKVGALGMVELPVGYVLYVGSALGPGGLRARVRHHWQSSARPRWHIDYLRGLTQLEEVWYTVDPARRECQWADCLGSMRGVITLLPGFGSSDCSCQSHLFFCQHRPTRRSFAGRRRRLSPGPQLPAILGAVVASQTQTKRIKGPPGP